ncbi:MAG: PorT family protein [Chitinophagaceae bacterium]|nr:PorT family protein [Chitinophagaceae bacterium]MBL0056387.1 PorT family protein [Chitinophagaceae bacterium]
MKSKPILFVLLCLIGTSAFSQKVQIGLKGGASINKLSGKSFKEEFSFGYHVGGFLTIGLGKKFAIQPEILFNQSNVDTSGSFSTIYQFQKLDKVKLNYLSFPILLNFKPVKMLTLQVGPQFGILMNQSSTLLQNGQKAFKSGDFSMLGGVQVNISHFGFYGRYNIGLSNINDIDSQEKWKNQSVQLGVAFRF